MNANLGLIEIQPKSNEQNLFINYFTHDLTKNRRKKSENKRNHCPDSIKDKIMQFNNHRNVKLIKAIIHQKQKMIGLDLTKQKP